MPTQKTIAQRPPCKRNRIGVSNTSMKAHVILASFLCCNASLLAQDREAQAEADIEKLLPIPSTEFIPPPPPKEVPAIKVEAATTRTLPTHHITVLRGEASTLPDIPQLLDGDGVAIAGSENPRTDPGQTNGMTEENPVANRIAHREMKMRIVEGEVLEGKELTWTIEPLYVHPDEEEPAFRGEWTHSTNHNTYFETSAHYGAYDFAAIAAQPTSVSATDHD